MKIDDVRALADRYCHYTQSLEIVSHWLDLQAEPDTLVPPEFDPIAVPRLLSSLYVLERDGARLRYRVSGEQVNSLFDRQHTGKFFDEVVPPDIHRIVEPFFQRVFDGTLCIFKGDVVLKNREFLNFERVLLPVTRQGRSLLLGCLALSNTATPRPEPPAALSAGFHFFVYNLADGGSETRWFDVKPQSFRTFNVAPA